MSTEAQPVLETKAQPIAETTIAGGPYRYKKVNMVRSAMMMGKILDVSNKAVVEMHFVSLGKNLLLVGGEVKAALNQAFRSKCTPEQVAFFKGLGAATMLHLLRDYGNEMLICVSVDGDYGDAKTIHSGGDEALIKYCLKLGFRKVTKEEENIHGGVPDYIATLGELRAANPIRPEHAALFK